MTDLRKVPDWAKPVFAACMIK